MTGGTTGIGFGAAECLIREGAIVYITGRRQDVLDNAVAKLGKSAREGYSKEQGMTEQQIADYAKRAATEIPAGRVGTSHDIGNALVFLASDHGSFIRGIDLVVDGGMTRIYQGHK